MRGNHKQLLIHYEKNNFISYVSDYLLFNSPASANKIIVLCIGTDRSTGDALGPFIGSYVTENYRLQNIHVYGTLNNPVHAKNLSDTIAHIYETYKKCFIIAIDASLGKFTSIGKVLCGQGSIKPGAAVHKKLPSVGHIYITGVVNTSGFMEFSVLQSTRLFLVTSMAKQIAKALYIYDCKISSKRTTQIKPNS